MESENRIIQFTSVADLLTAVEQDKHSNNPYARRYPVRFIFLNSFETFREIAVELKKKGVKECSIENFLTHNDKWIDNDTLFHKIVENKEDVLAVPFSEVIRFYSKQDFQNLFIRLMTHESPNQRIYLPLIGLRPRFDTDFFDSFTRKNESAALWAVKDDTPQSVKVYLTDAIPQQKIINLQKIETAKEWLCFWKRYAPSNIICSSKPLLRYYVNSESETVFTFINPSNIKELIKEIYQKNIPIEYLDEEKHFWEQLLNRINDNYTEFNKFVKSYCNITKLTIHNFITIWQNNENDFARWLLKHYIISQPCLKDHYIYNTLLSIEDYTNQTLFKHLYNGIFPIDQHIKYISERNRLIKYLTEGSKVTLSDDTQAILRQQIESITNIQQAIKVCTGLFDFEKELILNAYVDNKISKTEVENIFPELIAYAGHSFFDNLSTDQDWVNDYLSNYKKAKLHNTYLEEIKSVISEMNASETTFWDWYHGFESSRSILSRLDADKVYWVDGLSLEWISFIESYIHIKNNKIHITQKFVGRSELPTTTDYNQFKEIYKKFPNPDKYIHDNIYKYPYSIIAQFQIIKEIIDSILINFGNEETVAIVSDHGMTMLSRLVDSRKYGKNDRHEGRYIDASEKPQAEDNDYIYYQTNDNKKYLVALTHHSLGTKPIHETHGGCTPEEVLTPILVLSNKQTVESADYEVKIINPEIKKSNPLIQFAISGNPSLVHININSKRMRLEFDTKNNIWHTMLDKSLSGEYECKVLITNKEYPFKINIKAGMQKEDLF